jgi:large subunit ribosomal protein L13
MKIIDGKGMALGRMASYVAKEALKGEEVRIINCEEIIITGNRQNIISNFDRRKKWIGSTQKGPKYSRDIEVVVKKTIRGMLPEHRDGRGRLAYKRIRCYVGTPSEFENAKIEKVEKRKESFSHKIGDILK